MKFSLLRSMSVLFLIGIASSSAHADTTIVILRHAEKPDRGLGQLSCQGLNRSLAIPRILLARYGKPAEIYAPNPAVMKKDHGISYAYIRPLATVEPLAVQAGIPINVSMGLRDIEPLANALVMASTGVHMVVWEHHLGEALAKMLLSRLGGNPVDVPIWADDDFDSLYVIRSVKGAEGFTRTSFTHEQQGLNGMPISCPDVRSEPE